MRRAEIDAAMREALEREVERASYREPKTHEAERARIGKPSERGASIRVFRRRDAIPIIVSAVLSSTLLAAAVLADSGLRKASRPLACFLSESIPRDAGARLEEFVLSAGDSLRSSK